jgi:hypothetical protein
MMLNAMQFHPRFAHSALALALRNCANSSPNKWAGCKS